MSQEDKWGRRKPTSVFNISLIQTATS